MMRRTVTTALAGALVALAVVGGFMALDRTVLHWYAQEKDNAELAEVVARELLGDWERSVPERVRAEARDEFLRTGIDAPGEGSVEQFRYSRFRVANMAAFITIGEELMAPSSPRQQLERLHDCIGYLLATHQSMASCGLVSIAE